MAIGPKPLGASWPHPPELRTLVSERVNEATNEFLRKFRLWVKVAGLPTNLGHSFRRFQLVLLEPTFVAALQEAGIASQPRVDVDVTSLCRGEAWEPSVRSSFSMPAVPSRPAPGRLSRLVERVQARVERVSARVQLELYLRGRGDAPVQGIRRLMFVDASEIFYSRMAGRPYAYQKYLEGLIDIDNMSIADDTLVVLYGPLSNVDTTRLRHPRVAALPAFVAPEDRRVADVVDDSLWNTYFHDKRLTEAMLKNIDASEARRVFSFSLRQDLSWTAAAARLLKRFPQPLEIFIDSVDARLFAVTQFILRNFPQHAVVGVQKVLGPYTFSFNFRGCEDLFAQPQKMLAWSQFHAERLQGLGITCPIEPRGMYKLLHYRQFLAMDADAIKGRLGIPSHVPVVMFSAVQSIIGFSLIDRWQYYEMLQQLAEVCGRNGCYLLFKPWPGEDTTLLRQFVSTLFRHTPHQIVEGSDKLFHNVELLRVTDVLVSTMSSFIGEAFYFGAVPILVNTPACEAYFTREYTAEFRRLCIVKEEAVSLAEVLTGVLSMTQQQLQEYRLRVRESFHYLFGEPA